MKKTKIFLTLLLALALAACALGGAALAETAPPTIYVAQIGETKYETLESAITAAVEGDTVALLANTTEDITIDKAITLDLGGFTLSGTGTTSVIHANVESASAGSHLTIQNGTITGGETLYGGGIYIDKASHSDGSVLGITLNGLVISGNSATAGAGIYQSNGNVTVSSCTLSGNTAKSTGGAYYMNSLDNSTTCNMSSCTISGNTATVTGGGIAMGASQYISLGRTATMSVQNTSITGNTAGDNGGGINLMGDGSRFSMSGGSVSGNSSGWCGGGIYSDNWRGFSVSGVSITGNSAEADGGGLYVENINLTDNPVNMAVIAISNSAIQNNSAKGYGGGICVIASTLHVDAGSALYNNTAAQKGDDVYATLDWSANASSVTLPAATAMSGDLVLASDNEAITGWYRDGSPLAYRWAEENTEETAAQGTTVWHYVEYTPVAGDTEILALKAAHGYVEEPPPYVPVDPSPTYYTLTVRHVDEAGNELAATETSSHLAGVAYSTGAATIEGYAFKEMGAGSDAASGYMTSDKTVVYVYAPTTVIDGGETPLEPTPPVEIDPVDPPLDDTPKTGDAGLGSFLWLALCLSLAGLVTLGFSRKRRFN